MSESEVFQKDGVTIVTENRAALLSRTIYKNGQAVPYEYMWQVAPGPCVILTFENLWSFVHGKLPNMKIPLIRDGISRENLIETFSLIYGGEVKDEDVIELGKSKTQGKEKDVAQNLVKILETYREGTMVCGMRGHCTAVTKFENSYVKIDPQNKQGLEVFDREGIIDSIASRLGQGPSENFSDFFLFIHTDSALS